MNAKLIFGKAVEWAAKLSFLFMLLEVAWMLLPFAGFLYGSVLHIQMLGERPSTAWLTHFVFPILTLGFTGPILAALGLLVFMIGAGQIYWAKIRKKGLVTRGLYRFVRHPQYISLTLFGTGVLLTWGRTFAFIAFFLMMFLYLLLARSEERRCLRLFGDAYAKYMEATSFVFPGDRKLRPLFRLLGGRLPAPARALAAFAIIMGLCFGLMTIVREARLAFRRIPYIEAEVRLARGKPEAAPQKDENALAGVSAGVPFVKSGRILVVRGPYRNAAAPGFAERLLKRIPESESLKSFLSFLAEKDGDSVIAFCIPLEGTGNQGSHGPGSGRGPGSEREPGKRGPPKDPAGPDRVRVVLLRCTIEAGTAIEDVFRDKSGRKVRRACFAPVDLAAPKGSDVVAGPLMTPGPGFPAEERWDGFLKQLAERLDSAPPDAPAAPSAGAESARLVLVKAPILRTRRDPDFAQEILDRLVNSPTFAKQLAKACAGGDVVAVAFPRPGPDWYHEHHGTPQISVFVVLAKLKNPAAGTESVLDEAGRDLLGAFTAEMDFKIPKEGDSIAEGDVIGPRRDLEERWSFFLSGL